MTWRERRVPTNGVVLHCMEAGEGPLVLLLHGFPDCAHSWRFQIGPLADAGYHVVAPNLRGYDGSSRPAGVRQYRTGILAADVAGLPSALGHPRAAMVVGHDWGGVIAWRVATDAPQSLERLAIVNAPHPVLMARELSRNPGQMARSLYAFFFQLPFLPELVLCAGNFALLHRSVASHVRAGRLAPEDWAVMRGALEAPGALTAALNYYRAAGRRTLRRRPPGGSARSRTPLPHPGSIIWGERDPFLSPRLLEGVEELAPHMDLHRLDGAGHWAHWDEAEAVTAVLLELLRR